ncbi:hypothetical protein EAG_09494 [Camponotus floridanus]|uniref:Uncharacterized protein n=1 Tax=Camponotus floridanus TaxID=104421 RepID=E1ZZ62_CAMFO|nr:hypothetical protein EAG_09494 [Camponotus floridanus]
MTLRNLHKLQNLHRAFRTAAARCSFCVLITHRVLEENENRIDRTLDRPFRSRTGRDVNPESENRVNEAEAESQNNEVRVQFADETPKEQELTPLTENETEVEDENRDKRGSTGGGSGNILFDIIRTVASSGSNFGGEQKPIIGPTDSTPAIPGPVTRLLLIGNRGIADIIADLVLDRDEEAQEGASPALVPMDINAEPPLPERNTGTTLAT